MKCQELERLMVLEIEGELPRRHKAKLERHLSACVRCQEVFAEYRSLRESLSVLPPALVPSRPDLRSLMPARRTEPAWFTTRRIAYVPAGLALLFLLALGFAKINRQSAPQPMLPEQTAEVMEPAAATDTEGRFAAGTAPLLRPAAEEENLFAVVDYHDVLDNLSPEEQDEFLKILKEI